ncbi:ABC-F family ATP-binding cassette domain-containing protein [Amycolatopsis sp. 195334CR]|nr:ABC-F family ATP-binding cassette domain-containing protein [Amycolatopsis sp. 195334CR]
MHAVSKGFPGHRVLHDVTLTVRPGERAGIVGENGSGKSTLLRLMAGTTRPDAGEVTVRFPGGVGYLDQVLALPPEATVADAADSALADLRWLEAELRRAERDLSEEDLPRYGALLAEFERRDGYTVDARLAETLDTLGLSGLPSDRRLGELSGGERARLALAAVLAADPELLLLDEPTNHLDAQALAWLENRLRRHRGTVVAVSHDRLFLTAITTTLLEVESGAVRRYGTGYDGYLAERRAARLRWEQAYDDWKGEIARWTEFAEHTAYRVAPGRPMADHNKCKYHGDGRRVQQSITTRTRSARERLARLRAKPVPKPPDPPRFTTSARTTGAVAGPLLEVSEVDVPGRIALSGLSLRPGDRLLVTGPNGAGKSSLLRVLAGELAPGAVRAHGRVGYLPQDEPDTGRVGYLLQDEPDTGGAGYLPQDEAGTGGAGYLPQNEPDTGGVRYLPQDEAGCGGPLSVGQRRRTRLARLLENPVDVLLLDEPTNHFSPVLVEQLEAALRDYRGAVVTVSHDRLWQRRFREAHCRELTVSGGRLQGDPQ